MNQLFETKNSILCVECGQPISADPRGHDKLKYCKDCYTKRRAEYEKMYHQLNYKISQMSMEELKSVVKHAAFNVNYNPDEKAMEKIREVFGNKKIYDSQDMIDFSIYYTKRLFKKVI